jgi:hypothetical protein
MTEAAKPPAKPPAKPATAPASNGASLPEPLIELVEVSDRRLALALLLIGIGVGAAVVYLALTRLIIEDADHA